VDRPGLDGDLLSARPYVQGDSLRRVHWAHTARRDTLIVCERQSTTRRSVLVVLDPSAFRGGTKEENELCDWGLRVVASLCREFHGHACELSCELGGQRIPIAATAAALHRLFDQLARYQPATPFDLDADFSPTSAGQLTLFVTTGQRWGHRRFRSGVWASQVRVITVESDLPNQNEPATARPWLRVQIASEPGRQLQQQWERQCHGDWSAT
jgi:uncharacterized protein (DUF58 family)